jgi:hypothetical protein
MWNFVADGKADLKIQKHGNNLKLLALQIVKTFLLEIEKTAGNIFNHENLSSRISTKIHKNMKSPPSLPQKNPNKISNQLRIKMKKIPNDFKYIREFNKLTAISEE